jgi:trehalose-6-phosphate synthase
VPIHYIHRSTPRRRLAGIYRSSRIGMVTPLRDGMNLVAKEYVARIPVGRAHPRARRRGRGLVRR